MAARKAFFGTLPKHPDLDKLLEHARENPPSDEQLREQRVSFAYGNAPADSGITKDSVRKASQSVRIAS